MRKSIATDRALSFTVPGDPRPKERARTFYDERAKKVRTVTPKDTRGYESRVRERAYLAMCEARLDPLTRACELRLELHFALTKDAEQRGLAGELCDEDPDSSNVLKAIEDGCNKVVYDDDKRIAVHAISKRWVAEGESPRAEIQVLSRAGEWRTS